jgi:hypothetical protein
MLENIKLKDFKDLEIENYQVKPRFKSAFVKYSKDKNLIKEFVECLASERNWQGQIYLTSTQVCLLYLEHISWIIQKAKVIELVSAGFPKSDFIHLLPEKQ